MCGQTPTLAAAREINAPTGLSSDTVNQLSEAQLLHSVDTGYAALVSQFYQEKLEEAKSRYMLFKAFLSEERVYIDSSCFGCSQRGF